MNINDIIFATTCKDVCNVTYWDGTTDIVPKGIGELYKDLCRVSNHGRFFMIGRSTLICENNIIQINPSKGKLVMAFDTLNKKHLVLKGYSDDLLRKLRSNIS
jgi:hypothetical protein